MEMKYIMFKGNTDFLIFPESLSHDEVVLAGHGIKSAGFVKIMPNPEGGTAVIARCYGESTSLKIKSRPDHDSLVITIALNQ